MRNIMFCLFVALMLSSCSREIDDGKPRPSKVTLKGPNGMKMFSTTTEGPFKLELEGANVTITLLKDDIKVDKNPDQNTK